MSRPNRPTRAPNTMSTSGLSSMTSLNIATWSRGVARSASQKPTNLLPLKHPICIPRLTASALPTFTGMSTTSMRSGQRLLMLLITSDVSSVLPSLTNNSWVSCSLLANARNSSVRSRSASL